MRTVCLFLLGLVLSCVGCQERLSTSVPQVIPSGNDPAPFSEEDSAQAIFTRRILPIFQSSQPSSCTECHLSGVELKDYIRPTQSETLASLMAAGLIDVERPEESKILEFIQRTPVKSDLIRRQVRDEELSAFRNWIVAAVNEPKLLEGDDKAALPGPKIPLEVIRHARKDRVLASFMDNIWTEVGRCAACHSPDRNQKQVSEHGEKVSWIQLDDPQATLDYMLEAGLIHSKQPEASLLLKKPTLQVEHGGGRKMVVGDRSYKQFRRFIDDYAALTAGQYKSAEELPAETDELSVITDIWLKIEGVPEEYDKMLLQVDLYRRTDRGWSESRVATSDRPVFGQENLWQHSLSLVARRDSPWATEISEKRLPAGNYLAKIYVDQAEKLSKDFQAFLDESDIVAEIEISSPWKPGYGKMTVVKFPDP